MRAQARVVIIGAGVAGCSIAYHLAQLGWTEVVVVEQHGLAEGTTWHAAGIVNQTIETFSRARLTGYSLRLYAELAGRNGVDPGWRPVGGLRLATTREREEELLRRADAAQAYGLDMAVLSPAEVADRLPLLDLDGVRAAGWLPGDGQLHPEPLTRALADGARAMGVEFTTGTRVTGIEVHRGQVRAVVTDRRRIITETVVDAAGAAAGHVGRLAGVAVPVVPINHQYALSEPLTGVADVANLPIVHDVDHLVHLRGEGDGLLVAGYLRTPRAAWPAGDAAPLTTPRDLLAADSARFAAAWTAGRRRIPALRETAIAKLVNGVEGFTPDGEFLLGEAEVGGFWVATGFCGHGLAAAGGIGKVIAEWIIDGQPEYDVSAMDMRRFGAHAASRSWATATALAAYSRGQKVSHPQTESPAGRPLRRSAVWPRLAALDAHLGAQAGWELATWFGTHAGDGDEALRPAGWAGQVWSPAIEAECRATTEAAGLFDRSSLAKLDVRGAEAGAFLQWLCANDVDRPIGTVVHTALLNRRAGIEADVTVTRLDEAHFRIVTAAASGVRDAAWLRRHAPDGVIVDDVTGAYGCLCLWGPATGEILRPLTGPLDAGAMRAGSVTVGPVPTLAQRVSVVGEPGWEFYAPTEYVLTLWDLLLAAGDDLGLRPGGHRAIDAMRLEAGHRAWGSDLTPETTPDEAGLSCTVRIDKPFLGREALLAGRAGFGDGPGRRLRCLVLDDPRTVCLGDEPVRLDGRVCGRVTSGGYGYRVGASLAYAYLPSTLPVETRVQVGVGGAWQPAVVRPEPLYAPAACCVTDP